MAESSTGAEQRVALPFRDRADAGRQVGSALERWRKQRPIVLGIPRGGVPVAAAVARALGAPLDIIVARKLGAPGSPELALGAITADGGRFINEDVRATFGVTEEYLAWETARQLTEAKRREERLRGGRAMVSLNHHRPVILCDDGLATGATMRAALQALRARGVTTIVVAVPVGSHEACAALGAEADEVVCLATPEPFFAVGRYYEDFEPVEDAEVTRLLASAGPTY